MCSRMTTTARGDGSKSGPFHGGPVPPVVQILDVSQSTSVQTNPNLKAIILDDHSARLDVTGGDNNIFVAAGKGSDTINLHDSGNDTVYGGSGNDVIRGGHGDSSLFGGAGNDSIYGGTGNDTLDGGSGNDYLVSGALASGAGGHSPDANAGGHQRVASADDQVFGKGQVTMVVVRAMEMARATIRVMGMARAAVRVMEMAMAVVRGLAAIWKGTARL